MKKKLIFSMILVCLGGVVNSFIMKNIQSNNSFYHGFLISYFMFVGEISIFYFFNIKLLFKKYKKNHFIKNLKLKKINKTKNLTKNYIIGIGGIFDFIGSSFLNFSFIFLPASVSSIGNGGVIFGTFIFSKLILKKNIWKYKYLV